MNKNQQDIMPKQEVNINCDLGEGAGNDAAVIPYIHSANIACGFHAGDSKTIRETIDLCAANRVAIGAHPSFFDRENFGRKEMNLPDADIHELIIKQLALLRDAAGRAGQKLDHVKPHGALYNMSAGDPALAAVIANAVRDFDPRLVVYGLSGSHSITQARLLGLSTASEVFADRRYRDDGSLVPRSEPGSLLTDVSTVVRQVSQVINEGSVTSISGNTIPLLAETVCIHGDGKQVVAFARAIATLIKK